MYLQTIYIWYIYTWYIYIYDIYIYMIYIYIWYIHIWYIYIWYIYIWYYIILYISYPPYIRTSDKWNAHYGHAVFCQQRLSVEAAAPWRPIVSRPRDSNGESPTRTAWQRSDLISLGSLWMIEMSWRGGCLGSFQRLPLGSVKITN